MIFLYFLFFCYTFLCCCLLLLQPCKFYPLISRTNKGLSYKDQATYHWPSLHWSLDAFDGHWFIIHVSNASINRAKASLSKLVQLQVLFLKTIYSQTNTKLWVIFVLTILTYFQNSYFDTLAQGPLWKYCSLVVKNKFLKTKQSMHSENPLKVNEQQHWSDFLTCDVLCVHSGFMRNVHHLFIITVPVAVGWCCGDSIGTAPCRNYKSSEQHPVLAKWIFSLHNQQITTNQMNLLTMTEMTDFWQYDNVNILIWISTNWNKMLHKNQLKVNEQLLWSILLTSDAAAGVRLFPPLCDLCGFASSL